MFKNAVYFLEIINVSKNLNTFIVSNISKDQKRLKDSEAINVPKSEAIKKFRSD